MPDSKEISPCLGCKYQFEDKEPEDSICFNCEKRVIYDLSITDPRLIPDHIKEDYFRFIELQNALDDLMEPDEEECNLIMSSEQIDRRLKQMAKKNNFSGSGIEWITSLHNRGETISNISNKTGIGYGSIRKRIFSQKSTLITEKPKNSIGNCLYCHKKLERKFNSKTKKWEALYNFRLRKFCNASCAGKNRTRVLRPKIKPGFCGFCGKPLTEKKREGKSRFQKRKFCDVHCYHKMMKGLGI